MNRPVERESLRNSVSPELHSPTSTIPPPAPPSAATNRAREWLSLAVQPAVIRRALGYAVIVGAILIAINHGDALLSGDISAGRFGRMLLTVAVPYVVSTLSSVGAMRQHARSPENRG